MCDEQAGCLSASKVSCRFDLVFDRLHPLFRRIATWNVAPLRWQFPSEREAAYASVVDLPVLSTRSFRPLSWRTTNAGNNFQRLSLAFELALVATAQQLLIGRCAAPVPFLVGLSGGGCGEKLWRATALQDLAEDRARIRE